jgi:hypothetical protein
MPTPLFGYSRNDRAYLQLCATYGVIPNSSGAATLAATNAMRFVNVSLDPLIDLYANPSKTGSRDSIPGIAGRRSGAWTLEVPLQANGSAGVVSDYDALLQCIFGKAPTIVSSTSVTYGLSDTALSFILWRFRTASDGSYVLNQQAGISCSVASAEFNLGQNLATWSASGEAMWVLSSNLFSGEDSTAKSGLTSFPAEPTSPVTNGTPVAGFTGNISIGGNTMASIRTARIQLGINNSQVTDTFGSIYPTGLLAGERTVSADFELYDSNGSDIAALFSSGESKAGANVVIQLGTIAGNIWTYTLKNGQFTFPKVTDNSARFGLTCSATFHESSPGAKDAIALVVT